MQELLEELYVVAQEIDMSYKEIADGAGVSYNTIWRLFTQRTRFPRYQTIEGVVCAMGGELVNRPRTSRRKKVS